MATEHSLAIERCAQVADAAAADYLKQSNDLRQSGDPIDVEYSVAFHRKAMTAQAIASGIRALPLAAFNTDDTNEASADEFFGRPAEICDRCSGDGVVDHAFIQGSYGGSHAECPPDAPLVECEDCGGSGKSEQAA